MKILLDECVTKKLKQHLVNNEVYTVTELGWGGIKNGKLMALCVDNKFEILLTIDKNLAFQQNLDKYNLTIVIFNSFTSKIEEILQFVPFFMDQLSSYEKGKAYTVNK